MIIYPKVCFRLGRQPRNQFFQTYISNVCLGEHNNIPMEGKYPLTNMVRTPDQPPSLPAHANLPGGLVGASAFPPHASASSVCSSTTTATVNNNMAISNALNASSSTHSSNNFYQNTMQSDTSSLHKRKSVISSQSTGSSNDVSINDHLTNTVSIYTK